MAEGKSGFVLYKDIIHTIEKLPDDIAGKLFKHVLNYVNDKDPITDDIIINIAFEPIKQSLKRDLKKYRKIVERNRINGSKPKKRKKPSEAKKASGLSGKPSEAKKADSDSDSDSDIEENIYSDFYNLELENSNNNPDYEHFIKILYGENEDKKILKGVLSIRDQLTFEQFNSCMQLARKNNTKISEKLLKIDNDKKYFKGKLSLNRTLRNWLENRFTK